jgi:voltage-gated potassium channel
MSPQSRLERYEHRTEWPLVAVALTFLGLYSVRVLAKPHGGAEKAIEAALIAIFLVFILDYIVRLWLAQPRANWFFKHLWELPILLLPFLRPLRLLSLAVVINALQRAVGHTLRGRVIVFTACGAVAMIYAASLAILDVEGNHPEKHSEIDTLGDALWWAMTTVTTVGYGDVTPVSAEGRWVAVALMIGGITLLGSITATLASWIVQRVSEEDTDSQAVTAAHIKELRDDIRRLEETVRSYREDNAGGQVEGSK